MECIPMQFKTVKDNHIIIQFVVTAGVLKDNFMNFTMPAFEEFYKRCALSL